MASPQMCESLSDVAVIHRVIPRHAVKRVAVLMGAPLETARHWCYRQLSTERRRELAVALIAEMDAQDVERAALRRRLAQWAAGP